MKHKKRVLRGCLLLVLALLVFLSFQSPVRQPSEPGPIPVYIAPKDGRSDGVVNYAGLADLNKPPQTPPAPVAHYVPPKIPRAEKYVVINNKEYPLRTYKALLTPNDPLAGQWGTANAKLNQAWDTPVGSRQTTLAIIDTGFGLAHEEFTNRWYTNPGESGTTASEAASALNCSARSLPLDAACNLIDDDFDGIIDNETGPTAYQNPSRLNCTAQVRPLNKDCNRLDDDGNGHIDDVRGWDFINNDNSSQAGELNPNGAGTTHGTEVAGVAAATGNNAKGIAGVDWATKIMPLQALDDDGYGDTLSVGRAIFYAADQGADVISLSLGSAFPDPYVEEAVQAAIAKGIVVVAASGNDGCDCIIYPANYPEVVAVGALNTLSQPAGFSSWGDNLDILAPGTQVTSPTWSAANPTGAYASNLAGTSFAAPMVGGLLTRMLSHRTGIAPLQLIAALTENTNRLTLSPSSPRSGVLGYGALDAQQAVLRMVSAKSINQEYSFYPISKGQVLNTVSPAEVPGSYNVYQCDDGRPGTTPVYKLTRNGVIWFSGSWSEINQAVAAGHSATFFAYFCLQQPQDTPQTVRSINLFYEFLNIYNKQG
jgi:hypothetical protein